MERCHRFGCTDSAYNRSYPYNYFNQQATAMISVQGLPDTGCNVFYGTYVDNYNANLRTRYYIYDGQAVKSSTQAYTTPPNNVECLSSNSLIYDPISQTEVIIVIVIAVIAVIIGAYKVVIEPFIKMKKG